ncbi:MAG TPA: nucleotide disphospho-sugar-binding domain-containing protein [Acidimicrobiia bacterium]
MSRVLIVATAGAGGDLQPLVAAALALRHRGHETLLVGDRTVGRSLSPLGVETRVLPPELDLGPRLVAAIRDGMAASGGDLSAAGPMVKDRMTAWARETASPVADVVREFGPAVVVTSLFGVEVLTAVSPSCPWAVVNSTFFVGPNPPRPLEADFGPRAVALIGHFAALLGSADLVLHATDRIFDFSFAGLPADHHYVGPLGVWEPTTQPPAYLDQPGDPWVLVTISSQFQDDVPLLQAVLTALAGRSVRVVATLGTDHAAEEVATVPKNARIEQTVSHSAVLARGALMVSHAGHGSVMKALWHGRPMVLVPWGRDQPGVAARAGALGVAHVIPRDELSTDVLGTAVDRALTDARMAEASARMRERLLDTDPPGTTASLLETLL